MLIFFRWRGLSSERDPPRIIHIFFSSFGHYEKWCVNGGHSFSHMCSDNQDVLLQIYKQALAAAAAAAHEFQIINGTSTHS